MKNIYILILTIFLHMTVFSQEKCSSTSKELVSDLNAINKCNIKNTSSNEYITSRSRAASRYRFLKRRASLYKKAQIASSIKLVNVDKVKNDVHLSNLEDQVKQLLLNKSLENTVSFSTVEEIPQFSICSDDTLYKTDCFNYEMQAHIMENLNYPEEALSKKIEGNVWVSFIIDHNGFVKNTTANGVDNKLLKAEAIRLISSLPSFIPGKQNGVNTNVNYSFLISFTLN